MCYLLLLSFAQRYIFRAKGRLIMNHSNKPQEKRCFDRTKYRQTNLCLVAEVYKLVTAQELKNEIGATPCFIYESLICRIITAELFTKSRVDLDTVRWVNVFSVFFYPSFWGFLCGFRVLFT